MTETSEGRPEKMEGRSVLTSRKFPKTKDMSFQPEGAHVDLSTINEKRPSPLRNVTTKFQNPEDKEKN